MASTTIVALMLQTTYFNASRLRLIYVAHDSVTTLGTGSPSFHSRCLLLFRDLLQFQTNEMLAVAVNCSRLDNSMGVKWKYNFNAFQERWVFLHSFPERPSVWFSRKANKRPTEFRKAWISLHHVVNKLYANTFLLFFYLSRVNANFLLRDI